jgi:cytochrome c-type biogenesis protein CcmH
VRLAALLVAALLLAGCGASHSRPNAEEIETELVCPVCHETLDESDAPIAQQMKLTIRREIAAGWTKKQIMANMVANFGPGVLSTPSKHGFDLLAWVLPIGGVLIGVAALAAGARYWSRRTAADGPPQAGLDAAMERRIDDELARFDG